MAAWKKVEGGLVRLFGERYAGVLLSLVVALAIGGVLTHAGRFAKADRIVQDAYHIYYSRLIGQRYQHDNVVIASIDTPSLRLMSADPQLAWGKYYGIACRNLRLSGAKVVVFDVHLFATPRLLGRYVKNVPEELAGIDSEFLRELFIADNVVLASKVIRDDGVMYDLQPDWDYLLRRSGMGVTGVSLLLPDDDRVVRKYVVSLQRAGEGRAWSLAAQAALISGGGDRRFYLPAGDGEDLGSILYAGPPGSFRRVSFADIVGGDALAPEVAEQVRGKIVFVGFDCDALGDKHRTPYSGSLYPEMSGVEIHANILSTLLCGESLVPVPLWGTLAMWSVLVFFALFVHFKYPLLKKVSLFDAVWILVMTFVGFAFFCSGYLLGQGGFFVSLSVFFVLYNIVDMKKGFEGRAGERSALFWGYVVVLVSVSVLVCRYLW